MILTRLQMEPLALDAAAVYDPLVPRRRPTGWDVRGGMAGQSPINPINVQAYSWENMGKSWNSMRDFPASNVIDYRGAHE